MGEENSRIHTEFGRRFMYFNCLYFRDVKTVLKTGLNTYNGQSAHAYMHLLKITENHAKLLRTCC